MSPEIPQSEPGRSELILYQTEDGATRIHVRFEGETVWLSQNQMADLFETTKQNISLHVRNLFAEGELQEDSVVKEYLTTAADGKAYRTSYYNLDVIISIGYRVRSFRGTQFRMWATQRLREYIVKGFAMDDERLKEPGSRDYFDELLTRVRDIRSSERVFYRKVLDIYATSVDYDKNANVSQAFFATVQNKMHWAAHGHTAAELIAERADAAAPNMGLTNWKGGRIHMEDVSVAKNYLREEELQALNLIVSAYLDFAELQALGRKPMTMKDWISRLDGFLTLTDREILDHAGKVSRDGAAEKAAVEYESYRKASDYRPAVDAHFEEAIRRTKSLEAGRKRKPRAER